MRRRFVTGAILSGAILTVAFAYWWFRPGPNHRRTYRIGYGEDRPYHFTGTDGQPSGLAVDLVQEAARRRGIHLDWMKSPDRAIPALQSGKADMWVLLTIRPERNSQVYFSEPYLISDTSFLVPQDSRFQSAADLKNARISLLNFDVHRRNLAEFFPGAQQLPAESVPEVLAAVNDGRADAAYLDRYTGTAARLSGAGSQPLRLLASTVPQSLLAIGATFAASGIADEIRDEMKSMARDGTVARVIQRWEFFTFTDAIAYAGIRSRSIVALAAGFGALALVALAAGIFAYRLKKQRDAAHTQMAQRAQAEQDQQNFSRQLEQAQRIESVGRLAGGVAHDFNNLLTVINGYSDLMLKRMSPEDPWRRQVEGVRTAGARAAEVTHQLLAFSRKQVLLPKMLLLNNLVRESEGVLRPLLGKDIELMLMLDPALRMVEADPTQMHQVIVNLAANARDAMPSGGRFLIESANAKADEICTSCPAHAGHGRFVSLTITDTGIGMDSATLEHAFEPYFTNKSAGKGPGLGLATVHGVVRQSGGHIGILSAPGNGAKFIIHLPAVDRLADEEPTSKIAALGGTETLLVVEDEAEVRQMIGAILSAHGYRALQTGNGKEALRVFAQQSGRVDLLISDVVLPGMRGTEVAESLRKQDPLLRVLFISGYMDPTTMAPAFQSGAHYLQKPFQPEELVRKVRQVLGPRGSLD